MSRDASSVNVGSSGVNVGVPALSRDASSGGSAVNVGGVGVNAGGYDVYGASGEDSSFEETDTLPDQPVYTGGGARRSGNTGGGAVGRSASGDTGEGGVNHTGGGPGGRAAGGNAGGGNTGGAIIGGGGWGNAGGRGDESSLECSCALIKWRIPAAGAPFGAEKVKLLLFPVLQIGSPRLYPLHAFSNWSRSVHYRASLVIACPLGLLPWLLPACTSRSLSSISPPPGALVVLPRPILVLL